MTVSNIILSCLSAFFTFYKLVEYKPTFMIGMVTHATVLYTAQHVICHFVFVFPDYLSEAKP